MLERMFPRSLLTVGLCLALVAGPEPGRGQAPRAGKDKGIGKERKEDGNNRRPRIETSDGVKLRGYYYPAAGKKRDATVLLLHGLKKGETFQKDEWLDLAEALQKDGYAVLGFDCRGYGDSKDLSSPEAFWSKRYNLEGVRRTGAGGKLPEHIEASQFSSTYYQYLLNDVLAAKSFLDRRNDAGELNVSNLFVIGADESAALGLMWMGLQWRLVRDKNPPGVVGGPPNPDEPEGRDLVGAVWLGAAHTLGGQNPSPSPGTWVRDLAKDHKVPMLFVYGGDDTRAESTAHGLIRRAFPTYKPLKITDEPKDRAFQLFREWGIPKTKLTGSTLLQTKRTTSDIQNYLDAALNRRGPSDSKVREASKSQYFWTFPPPSGSPNVPTRYGLAKRAGESVPDMPPPLVLNSIR